MRLVEALRGTGRTSGASAGGGGGAHASTHRTGSSDVVQLTQAQIDGLVAALAALAPLASPVFTGNPLAPTQAPGSNNTRLATTEFVEAALTALRGTAPGVLDTLGEIADAINDDANLYTTLVDAIAAKVSDTAYDAATWDGVTGVAASKNAVRDLIEALRAVSFITGSATSELSGEITLGTVMATGTLAARPAATAVPAGSIYWSTDAGVYRSDASAWTDVRRTAALTPFTPVGLITETDTQAAVAGVSARTAPDFLLFSDRAVAYELADEFFGGGSFTAGGRIGNLGWSIPSGITGTSPAHQATTGGAGAVIVGATTVNGQWSNINLGVDMMELAPVFRVMFRMRITGLNDGANDATHWIGLHSDNAGAAPNTGFFFRLAAADGANWRGVTRNGGGSATVTDLGATYAPAANVFQWLEIRCNGSNVVTFYINGNLVGTQTNPGTLPTGSNRYGPSITSLRTASSGIGRPIHIDTFLMRVELAR